jgi:hypothetical protein
MSNQIRLKGSSSLRLALTLESSTFTTSTIKPSRAVVSLAGIDRPENLPGRVATALIEAFDIVVKSSFERV